MLNILNVFGEHFTPEARAILEELGAVTARTVNQKEVAKIIGDYDVVVTGLYPEFSRGVLEKAGKLKAIATVTTNLDHIDLACAEERGVKVISLRGEDTFLKTVTGTAELAAGLMLALSRMLPWAFEDVLSYRWNREAFRGHSLSGKTLGIVGLGRLGTWMARYGRALNMRVIACSPHTDDSDFAKSDCERVDWDTLLRESDVISIHVHLKDDTEHMFNAAAFAKMKKDAIIVNTAVRNIVDDAAILTALQKGTIGGYATDVLSDELEFDQGFTNHPLVEYAKTHRNCIIVPHIGGMTHESRSATDIFIAKKLRDFLKKSS